MTEKKAIKKVKLGCDPLQWIAFGFGSGLSPIGPGTCGTVVGVLIYLFIQPLNLFGYLLITLIFTVLGVWLCGWSAKKIGVHDYPGIVWDEVVGYLWAMFAVPFHWYWVIAGFVLFRLFDIWKPWPIRWLDHKVSGGLGIMLDDLVAALYAWIVLQLIILVLTKI